MKKNVLLCSVAVLLIASVSSGADIGWIAMDDGDTPEQEQVNWNDPNSWTLKRIPAADDKVKFYSGTAECIIDSSVVGGQMVIGDGGPAVIPEENFIHILNGGTLTTGTFSSWSAIGYNKPAQVIVEKGGMWDTGNQHFWLGMQPGSEGSKLIINGGTVKNGNNHALQCGRQEVDGARGGIDISIISGIMECGRLADNDLIRGENSSIDIQFGTLMFHRTNIAGFIQNEIDAGLLTAFGEHGNDGKGAEINMVVGGGLTVLTANDPMEASPTYDEEELYFEDVTLSWKNKDPNDPSGATINVWFGQLEDGANEPNKLGPLYNLVVDNEPWSEFMAVTVGQFDIESGKYYLDPGKNEYYWQVELINPSGLIQTSTLYKFTTTDNRPPWNVNAGNDIHTWINAATQLLGSFEDENTPTVLWTSSDPAAVFSPSDDGGVTSTAIDPTVTVDYAAGAVTLTFMVDDGVNPTVSDNVTVTVWNDACEAARDGLGEDANHPGDFTGPDGIADCKIDILDLIAEMASKWLTDYALQDPVDQQ